jgi:hypothetical protein
MELHIETALLENAVEKFNLQIDNHSMSEIDRFFMVLPSLSRQMPR